MADSISLAKKAYDKSTEKSAATGLVSDAKPRKSRAVSVKPTARAKSRSDKPGAT